MICAGDGRADKIGQGVSNAELIGCKAGVASREANSDCSTQVRQGAETHTLGMSAAQLDQFLSFPYSMATISLDSMCRFEANKLSEGKAGAFADCFTASVTDADVGNQKPQKIPTSDRRELPYHPYLAEMAAQIRAGTYDPAAAVRDTAQRFMPQVLTDYLEGIKDSYPLVHKHALRLYQSAMAKVKPEEIPAAAPHVAGHIQTWADGNIGRLSAVGDDEALKQADEAHVVTSFVKDVTNSKNSYAVTIDDLVDTPLLDSVAIGYDPNDPVPLLVPQMEVMRQRFEDALGSYAAQGGKDIGSLDIAGPTAAAIKAVVTKNEIAFDDLAKTIGGYRAKAVLKPDKSLKAVVLKKRGLVETPSALINEFNPEGKPLITAALGELWQSLLAAAKSKGLLPKGKKLDEVRQKLADGLADALRKLSTKHHGMSPELFARAVVVDVDEDGKVLLLAVPEELLNEDILKQITAAGGVALLHALKRLFIECAAMDGKKYFNNTNGGADARQELAEQIAKAAKAKLFDSEAIGEGKFSDETIRKGIADLFLTQCPGFDSKGKLKKLSAPGISATKFPATKDGRFSFEYAVPSEVGYASGDAVIGTGWAYAIAPQVKAAFKVWDKSAEGETPSQSLELMVGAQAIIFQAHSSATLAGEGESLAADPGPGSDKRAFMEAWGGVKYTRGKSSLTVKAGVTPKHHSFLGEWNGLGYYPVGLDSYQGIGPSRTVGSSLEGTISTLEDRLRISGLVSANSYMTRINLYPDQDDKDKDGTPDDFSGQVYTAALAMDAELVQNWWRVGLDVHGQFGNGGGDRKDANGSFDSVHSPDGQIALTADLSTALKHEEEPVAEGADPRTHLLALNGRIAIVRNSHYENINSNMYLASLLYAGSNLAGGGGIVDFNLAGGIVFSRNTTNLDLPGNVPYPYGRPGGVSAEDANILLTGDTVAVPIRPELVIKPHRWWMSKLTLGLNVVPFFNCQTTDSCNMSSNIYVGAFISIQ